MIQDKVLPYPYKWNLVMHDNLTGRRWLEGCYTSYRKAYLTGQKLCSEHPYTFVVLDELSYINS